MYLFTLIGLGGVGFYICSYALVQLHKMDGNGAPYTAMNVVGASMVLVSLFDEFNLPSLVTQIMWIGIGVTGLTLRARQRMLVRQGLAPNEANEQQLASRSARPREDWPTVTVRVRRLRSPLRWVDVAATEKVIDLRANESVPTD